MVWIVLLVTLAAVAYLSLYDAGGGQPTRRAGTADSGSDGGSVTTIAAGSSTHGTSPNTSPGTSHNHAHSDTGGHSDGRGDVGGD